MCLPHCVITIIEFLILGINVLGIDEFYLEKCLSPRSFVRHASIFSSHDDTTISGVFMEVEDPGF